MDIFISITLFINVWILEIEYFLDLIVCSTKHYQYRNLFGIVGVTFNERKNRTNWKMKSVHFNYLLSGFMASDIWRDTFFPSSPIYSCTPSDPSYAQLVLQRISLTLTRTTLNRDEVVPSKTVLLNFRLKQANKWIVSFVFWIFELFIDIPTFSNQTGSNRPTVLSFIP